jgi:hypothetical protein
MEMTRLQFLMIDRCLNVLETPNSHCYPLKARLFWAVKESAWKVMHAVINSGVSGILHLPHISRNCTPKKTLSEHVPRKNSVHALPRQGNFHAQAVHFDARHVFAKKEPLLTEVV